MHQNLLKFAIITAKKAGKLAMKAQQKTLTIIEKAKNDLVTNADKACEELIIKEIHKVFPDHAIIGEESSFIKKTSSERTARARSKAKNPRLGGVLSQSEPYQIKDYTKSEFIWLIDPIDGTTNYAHGLKEYAISIGLFQHTTKLRKHLHAVRHGLHPCMENNLPQRLTDGLSNHHAESENQYLSGELILGVVYAPAMNEIFYAAKNRGSYLNGKKIHTSKQNKIANSFLATGFPYQNREMNLPYFSKMLDNCQAIRRLGAASLDLCYVAAGRFDGYWEFDTNPWDIAAGSLIVKEAGGRVTNTNGNQIDIFGKNILATNKKIHQEIIKKFRNL